MKDQSKTKQALIQELASSRQRIKELEQSESEWKEGKEGLKKSKARFSSYFDLPLHGIAITSPEKEWIEVNDRICSIMGYSRDEIVRMTWSEMTHPDDLAADLEQFNRVLSGQIEHYNMDKRFIRKDGKIVWTNLSVGCVRKSDGSGDYIIALVEDITSGKLAEEALTKSEEKFRKVFYTSPDSVNITRLEDGMIVSINPGFTRITGYTEADIIGKTAIEDNIWDNIEDRQRLLAGLKKDGEVANLEVTFRTKGGDSRYGLMSASIIDLDGVPHILSITRDITARKQAEEALRESENKYRLLADNVDDVIYVLDMNLNYTYVSPSVKILRGYEPEEVLKQQSFETLTPSSWDLAMRTLSEVMELAKSEHRDISTSRMLQLEAMRKDGTTVWTEAKLSLIRDKNQRLVGILGVSRDITERKRAEETLRSSEQRLSWIIEFLPDATLVIDKEGKVIAWNRAIEVMTGVKAEDVLGKGNYEYALPFYGERRPILIDLALHPQPEREKSYTHIRKIGDILFGEAYSPGLIGGKTHVSSTASVLRNAKGEIIAAIECIRDNTEQRQAQEDLHQAVERYRSIFENAQEGIFRSTPDGKVIMANQAMAKMFGYESPEEMKTSITDIAGQHYVNPEDRRKLKEMIDEHGFIKNHVGQNCRKDGGIIWVSRTMHAVRDEQGQIMYYDGIIEDITNRKQAVERIRKALGATVQAIAVMVETRDPYTAGHQRRVADLARAIATEMNLSVDLIDGIRMAASIHDIGKISVPAEILSKPTRLTDIEFSLIKTHSLSGYNILKDIEFPWPIARMILEHHERMDGSGYPNGLTGENILLESRILAVADVVESMASDRPYRPAIGIGLALEEIERNQGVLYDPLVVQTCLRLIREKGFQWD